MYSNETDQVQYFCDDFWNFTTYYKLIQVLMKSIKVLTKKIKKLNKTIKKGKKKTQKLAEMLKVIQVLKIEIKIKIFYEK